MISYKSNKKTMGPTDSTFSCVYTNVCEYKCIYNRIPPYKDKRWISLV